MMKTTYKVIDGKLAEVNKSNKGFDKAYSCVMKPCQHDHKLYSVTWMIVEGQVKVVDDPNRSRADEQSFSE